MDIAMKRMQWDNPWYKDREDESPSFLRKSLLNYKLDIESAHWRLVLAGGAATDLDNENENTVLR